MPSTIEVLERALDTFVSMIQLDWDQNCAAYPDLPAPFDIGWILTKGRHGYTISILSAMPQPFDHQRNFIFRSASLEEGLLAVQEQMARTNESMNAMPILPRQDGVQPIVPHSEWDIDADLDANNLRVED